jgi:hypothetical protein
MPRDALEVLGRRHTLALVTPRESGGGASSDARVVRSAGRRYPERVTVLDWVAYSAGHAGSPATACISARPARSGWRAC